jgi:hypothetical protein
MALKFELDPLADGDETFDLSFTSLRNNTRQEVVKVIIPFLQFLKSFYSSQIHNMLALMLNPHVKSL